MISLVPKRLSESKAILKKHINDNKTMEQHYICTGGCGGVSDKPGVCQTEGCADYQKPLRECHCEDGLHEQVKEQEAETGDK